MAARFSKGPPPPVGLAIPQGLVSAPEHVKWHMILDLELGFLSQSETGLLGAIGFTALGGAVGLAPSLASAIEKKAADITGSDLMAIAMFAVCTTAAIICLVIFGVARWRTRGLVQAIRDRGAKPSGDAIA